MTTPFTLPDPIIARFRVVAFERLARIDTTWAELAAANSTPTAEQQMFRDLHTLKGDARIIGFGDVSLLCQRLEDLLFAARSRSYRVHDDVDVVVTMAIQFISMLLRKKVGAPRIGIDLEGFLKQIEDVISEWLRKSSEAPGLAVPVGARPRLGEVSSVPAATRNALALAATDVYLEQLRASGRSRARLNGVWELLSREVAQLEAAPIAPLFERHSAAALDLARELGKRVGVVVETGDVRVKSEALEVINVVLLHTIRNAVDHGIELPAEREGARKPEQATIRLRAARHDDGVEIVIADDGAGVHFDRVRAHAVARGLLKTTDTPSDDELVELLFRPGFTTRDLPDAVSGRGIGMDAVRDAVHAIGGRIVLETLRGAGTTITLSLEQPRTTLEVHAFRAIASTPTWLAVPSAYRADVDSDAGSASDPLEALDISELRGEASSTSAIRLHGEVDVILRAEGPVKSLAAKRLCATPRDALAEIVELDGGDVAILVRPDVLVRGSA